MRTACESIWRRASGILPGFLYRRWQRCFDERGLVALFGPTKAVTPGMLLGVTPLPACWEADQ